MEIQHEGQQKGGSERAEEKWVYDSSVDHRGRIPLRASTGVWKASLFIIAMELSERLSYFGIATNLMSYLSKELHQDVKTAARNVNYWVGVTTIMPLIGGFVADAYWGRFRTVVVSSIVYLLGLGLLTTSQYVPSLKPCEEAAQCEQSRGKLHSLVFFLAIYLISVGTGGHKPSLESFGADQFDDDHPAERRQRMSYFNWWSLGLCSGLILGVTVVAYVQQTLSWGAGDAIMTAVMAASTALFLMGTPFYRYRVPRGSPLTPLVQVLVAAFAKRHLPLPANPSHLYEQRSEERERRRVLGHTSKLSFLDKAAIIEDSGAQPTEGAAGKASPWKLATVTQVEEMKLVVNVVHIWLASLVFGICVAQSTTFFLKQGAAMDRHLSSSFTLPPASIFSVGALAMIASVAAYDKLLVPLLRRATGNERGISILQRIGAGMAIGTLGLVAAALVERKRLTSGKPIPVFWLAPQFVILGAGDAFALVGLQEYFYDQVPDSMRSLGIALYLSVLGASNFLSSLLITVVDRATERAAGGSWFAGDLKQSRLDKFYWLLAVMGGLNLCVYVFVASRYSYKSTEKRVAVADSYDSEVLP